MLRKSALLIMLALTIGCAKESTLSFEISEGLLSFRPQFKDSLLYTDGVDSLYLRISSDISTHPRIDAPGDLGSLGEADGLELEEVRTVYRFDSLMSLEYYFSNQYSAAAAYPITETVAIKLVDHSSGSETALELTTADSLRCNLNCTFADTLRLDSTTSYYNVYFSDSTQQRIIYINQSRGMPAFKVDKQLFKRIN